MKCPYLAGVRKAGDSTVSNFNLGTKLGRVLDSHPFFSRNANKLIKKYTL